MYDAINQQTFVLCVLSAMCAGTIWAFLARSVRLLQQKESPDLLSYSCNLLAGILVSGMAMYGSINKGAWYFLLSGLFMLICPHVGYIYDKYEAERSHRTSLCTIFLAASVIGSAFAILCGFDNLEMIHVPETCPEWWLRLGSGWCAFHLGGIIEAFVFTHGRQTCEIIAAVAYTMVTQTGKIITAVARSGKELLVAILESGRKLGRLGMAVLKQFFPTTIAFYTCPSGHTRFSIVAGAAIPVSLYTALHHLPELSAADTRGVIFCLSLLLFCLIPACCDYASRLYQWLRANIDDLSSPYQWMRAKPSGVAPAMRVDLLGRDIST